MRSQAASDSNQKLAETPLPWKKVIPILVLLAAEAFNGVSIFSYITLLVMDFMPQLKDEHGNYSGVGYFLAPISETFAQ